MDEILDKKDVIGKVFKEKAVWISALIGGPIIGGFVLSVNFRRIGKPREAKLSLVLGVIMLVAILGLSFLVPAAENIPDFFFSLLYAYLALIIFQKFQKKDVLRHLYNGGEIYNWGQVTGVIVIGVLILFVILMGLVSYEDGSYRYFF